MLPSDCLGFLIWRMETGGVPSTTNILIILYRSDQVPGRDGSAGKSPCFTSPVTLVLALEPVLERERTNSCKLIF